MKMADHSTLNISNKVQVGKYIGWILLYHMLQQSDKDWEFGYRVSPACEQRWSISAENEKNPSSPFTTFNLISLRDRSKGRRVNILQGRLTFQRGRFYSCSFRLVETIELLTGRDSIRQPSDVYIPWKTPILHRHAILHYYPTLGFSICLASTTQVGMRGGREMRALMWLTTNLCWYWNEGGPRVHQVKCVTNHLGARRVVG